MGSLWTIVLFSLVASTLAVKDQLEFDKDGQPTNPLNDITFTTAEIKDDEYDTFIEVHNALVGKEVMLYWMDENHEPVFLNHLKVDEKVRHLCNFDDEFFAKTKDHKNIVRKWGYMKVLKHGIQWQIMEKAHSSNYHGTLHIYNDHPTKDVYVYWYPGRPYESTTGAMHLIDIIKPGSEIHEIMHWGQSVEFNFEDGQHAVRPIWFNFHDKEIVIEDKPLGPITDQYVKIKYFKEIWAIDEKTGEKYIKTVKKEPDEIATFSTSLGVDHPLNIGRDSIYLPTASKRVEL